jgi:hypothetical protein
MPFFLFLYGSQLKNMPNRENVQLAIMVVGATASVIGALFTALIATNLHKKLQVRIGTDKQKR